MGFELLESCRIQLKLSPISFLIFHVCICKEIHTILCVSERYAIFGKTRFGEPEIDTKDEVRGYIWPLNCLNRFVHA